MGDQITSSNANINSRDRCTIPTKGKIDRVVQAHGM